MTRALTRHPWYLGTLLAIWTGVAQYRLPLLVAAMILSGYLVIGTLLEERRIVRVFGEAYRGYQRQVSMLLPWKWLQNRWVRCLQHSGKK